MINLLCYSVVVKLLERRTSNISVSSQGSLEEDELEARRKRFARKGSRESSLQDFLEDRLSESKSVAKGRHLSSSSISFEVSVDEDIVRPEVKINPDMLKLKQFLHERFAAKDKKDSENKSQQDAKQKRARMQRQPTITEEPTGKAFSCYKFMDLSMSLKRLRNVKVINMKNHKILLLTNTSG